MVDEPLLKLEGITKSFGSVEVLHGVDFDIRAGEVHAVIGENGAGKSTLMNILAGVYGDYGGTYRLNGKEVRFSGPREAQQHGVVMIHQERQVVKQLSVAENIRLGQLSDRMGVVRWHRMREQAEAALAEIGVKIDPTRKVSDLNAGEVKVVEIARALQRRPRVLIMDEPTASLTPGEIDALFEVVRRFKEAGGTIVYISHHLAEVFRIADRVSVLRDGALVISTSVGATSAEELVRSMVGRTLQLHERIVEDTPETAVLLEVENLETPAGVKNVSFEVHEGEIVALAGLVGSRRTETALAIFGADPCSGRMLLSGRPYAPSSPADAIAAGVVYLSEDRASTGLLLEATVADNLTLTRLRQVRGRLGVDTRRINTLAEELIARLRVVPPQPGRSVNQLSGGNQQKVALGKSLVENAKLLILDEPTRGVDVGAKADIHRVIVNQATEGRGVLLISSDVPEIWALAHRVIVLQRGEVAAELSGEEATEEAVLAAVTMGKVRG